MQCYTLTLLEIRIGITSGIQSVFLKKICTGCFFRIRNQVPNMDLTVQNEQEVIIGLEEIIKNTSLMILNDITVIYTMLQYTSSAYHYSCIPVQNTAGLVPVGDG